jgi:hypothetical protein
VVVADHLIEVDRLRAVCDGTEETARLDLAKLLGIADKDELRLRLLGVEDHSCQSRRVHHPGLIDEQDRASRQSLPTLVLGTIKLDQEAGDGGGGKAVRAHHVRRSPGGGCGA